MPLRSRLPVLSFLLLVYSWSADSARAAADEVVTVAVASNFAAAMRQISTRFEVATGHQVRVSAASTGKLYAQIVNGAPFDVFLAADAERPGLLEAAGLTAAGSRFTYAVGRLVVWSRDPAVSAADCREALGAADGGRIAIANPDTAPYGAAALEVLTRLGLWPGLGKRLVTGENVGQTLHFAASGNATFGFVAAAQIASTELPRASCTWDVPADMHGPIEQQAVLLARASRSDAGRAFMDFLRGEIGRGVIAHSGYALPDGH